MKRSVLWGIIGVGVSSAVFAQDVAAPPPVRSTMATRPLNLANPRGTDSGAGVACNLVMDYGMEQPPGQAAVPYGPGIAPQPTEPAAASAAPAPDPAAITAAARTATAPAAGRRA